jgi:asparagine synthase (glutamine-hydrolysing)
VAEAFPQGLRLHALTSGGEKIRDELRAYQAGMDEPFHSPNMILNREIWRRLAALGIRVSLNGAGGDEVFAGYGGEYFGPYVRHLAARGRMERTLEELVRYSERESNGLKPWLRELWLLLPDAWKRTMRPLVPDAAHDPLKLERGSLPAASESLEQRLLEHLGDLKMNYWLRSGNTSCMSVPLEVRLPLLDSEVVEWACRLPLEYLIRDGWMKWALRKAMEPRLPPDVVWRRVKMGFPFPLREWLLRSRPDFESLRRGADTPFLDRARLFAAHDFLADHYPNYLWRCLSALLWWECCVLEEPIFQSSFQPSQRTDRAEIGP